MHNGVQALLAAADDHDWGTSGLSWSLAMLLMHP